MQVILLERLANLGPMGTVVEVKPGYARNFLLPQKKALRATQANLDLFAQQRKTLEASNSSKKEEAEAIAKKFEGLSISIIRQAGESGHLYGSVSLRDIADKLVERGMNVDKRQVGLMHPIKEVGLHNCEVHLHPEVSMKVVIVVAPTEEEAQNKIRSRSSTHKEDSPKDSVEGEEARSPQVEAVAEV